MTRPRPIGPSDAANPPDDPQQPMGARTDRLFATSRAISDFDFGAETAAVFDDMLERSVPYYDEIQRQVAELTVDFAADAAIYDLGCSTCAAFLRIAPLLPPDSK